MHSSNLFATFVVLIHNYMILAPLKLYLSIIGIHIALSLISYFIFPNYNWVYIGLVTFVFTMLFASTEDGIMFFESDETNEYYE